MNIKVGKTIVKVIKRVVDEATKRVKIIDLHEGTVVQNFGTHVRVYNPAPQDKGGDVGADTSEVFPLSSPSVWCEIISEHGRALPIPPLLRG